MRADTRLPPYLPYPRFLLQTDPTQTAKLLYALLLDRATLSQANGWLDEGGRIYLVFPIEKIAAALDRSPMTVKNALSELEDAGLIERRRSGFSKPNRIYVKLPPDGQKTFQLLAQPWDKPGRVKKHRGAYQVGAYHRQEDPHLAGMLMCGKVTNKNLIDSHPTIPLVHIVIWKD